MNRQAQVLALLEDELRAAQASGETYIGAEEVRAAAIAALSQRDGAPKAPHPAEAHDLVAFVSDAYEELGYIVIDDEQYDLNGLCEAAHKVRAGRTSP